MPTTNCPHCNGTIVLLKSGVPPTPAPASPDPDWDALADEKPSTTPKAPRADTPAKPVTCNRCKETGLAWAQSKSGKYYLCKMGPDGQPLRREFHKCT